MQAPAKPSTRCKERHGVILIPAFRLSQAPLQDNAPFPCIPSQEHGSQTQATGVSLTAARQEQGTLRGKADYSPLLELIRACLN